MIRICTTLANAGYRVSIVGRLLPASLPVKSQPFRQRRLKCVFNKGPLFYAEFNLRLFLYLLLHKTDLVCAVDLDTILPVYLASAIRSTHRVYDAHELFCEMKEVVSRPAIYKCWRGIEKRMIPRFRNGYTVNQLIADEFNRLYQVNYAVIMNLPLPSPDIPAIKDESRKIVLYQGAVNEGRSFETLIPAMKDVDAQLVICGNGNFMTQARKLVELNNLQHKVVFTGWLEPDKLREVTRTADVGVNIIEDNGLNNRYSLSNRFFDYIQSELPQVCVNYPAYQSVNSQYHCAVLIDDTSSARIAGAINTLLNDHELYQQLKANCAVARKKLTWNNEEPKLLDFYKRVLNER